MSIPTDNLNGAVGDVVFSALSRLQDDRPRLRSYFLKGYSVVLAMTLPATIACALFAADVVGVLLGPKWKEAAAILRLLAPTILVLALINPLGWLMFSLGLLRRGLKVAVMFAPTVIVGYFIGLPYGPKGVAFAYSAVMVLWVIPFLHYCVQGTGVSLWDVLQVVSHPVVSGICAGAFAFGTRLLCSQSWPALPRLVLESGVLLLTFVSILLFVVGEESFYLDLLKQLKGQTSVHEKSFASC